MGRAFRSAVPLIVRPRILLPFLVMAAAQFGALGLLVWFHEQAILPVALPLVRLLGGETATHYPVFFFALPTMFSRVGLVLAVFLFSVAAGAATLLFARAFGFKSDGNAWKRALRVAPVLIILTALEGLLLFGLSLLAEPVPQDSQWLRWGTRGGLLLGFIVIEAFLVYSTAWVMLAGHNIVQAIRDSIRVTTRTLLPTLLIVGIPAIALYPFSYLSGRVDLIATKLRPEMVTALLTTRIVLETLLTFLLIGAITRLFLWRLEERP